MKIIKRPCSTSLKLKELMKAVKEAGGNLEQEMKARKILKNYLEQAKKNGSEQVEEDEDSTS